MKDIIRITNLFGLIAFLYMLPLQALAENTSSRSANKARSELAVAFGYSRISINELVYKATGDGYLSHLRWNANAPVVRFSTSHNLTGNWSLSGNMIFNMTGDADLTNQDWIDFDQDGPFTPGSGPDDWTHRSQHSKSNLLRYIDLDVALGRDFQIDEITAINLHGGLKYSLVELNAHGGNYIYSQNGFRDNQYTLRDDQPVINYQQWYRTVFAGTEATHHSGNWRLSGLIRAGLSLEPRDIDEHWRRNLRFDGTYGRAAFVQARLRLARVLKNGILVFANANYQKHFEQRGDVSLSKINDGMPLDYAENSVGIDMSATTFEIGISRDF